MKKMYRKRFESFFVSIYLFSRKKIWNENYYFMNKRVRVCWVGLKMFQTDFKMNYVVDKFD